MRTLGAWFVGLSLFASGPAWADLTVRERITTGDGKSVGEQTWTYAPERIRLDQGGAGFILDAARGRAWIFGREPGSCQSLPAPFLAAGTAPTVAASPEKQRLAKLVGELEGGGAPLLVAKDERRTIAKVEAQRYDVVRDGEKVQERWLASSVPADDLDAILERLRMTTIGSPIAAMGSFQLLTQGVGLGYPVLVKDLVTGRSAEAIEIRTAKLPAAAFTPPPGCAER